MDFCGKDKVADDEIYQEKTAERNDDAENDAKFDADDDDEVDVDSVDAGRKGVYYRISG